MIPSRFVRQALLVLSLSIILASANIAFPSEYQPTIGQEGKDVIWLPTCQALVDTMLDMAKVTSQDYVIDLGSGDGRLVITAAKRGARTLGIEYNPDMVALSKRNAINEGVTDQAKFIEADIFESDFSEATVITMFLLDELNLRLRPTILNLKPGTRVVSNTFRMGLWKPDQTIVLKDRHECHDYYTAHLWIVPAKVEGTWMLPQGELTLSQSFQTFSGTLHDGVNAMRAKDGKISGDRISFNVGYVKYTGRVSGNTMEGIYESGGTVAKWRATRSGSDKSQRRSRHAIEWERTGDGIRNVAGSF